MNCSVVPGFCLDSPLTRIPSCCRTPLHYHPGLLHELEPSRKPLLWTNAGSHWRHLPAGRTYTWLIFSIMTTHTRERERDNEGIKRGISWINTSRKEVVSRIKNMLIIPRYLMIRVPGRKDRGVIFTTVTVLPPNEQLERSERERPSGSGLQRSMDETAGTKKKKKKKKKRMQTVEIFFKILRWNEMCKDSYLKRSSVERLLDWGKNHHHNYLNCYWKTQILFIWEFAFFF